MSTMLFIAGTLLLFATERYFPGIPATDWLRGSSVVLIAASIATGWLTRKQILKHGKVSEETVALWSLAWKFLVIVGIIAWACWTNVPKGSTGPLGGHLWRILLAAWLIPIITGLVAGFSIEWTSIRTGADSDPGRIHKAARAGIATGMLFCSLFALNYAAVRRDVTRDWSYLKVTEPSETTVNIVKASSDEIQIAVFYPRDSEVLPWVEPYLEKLARLANSEEGKIAVQVIDKELDPVAAERFQTSRSGVIVAASGNRTERIDLGPTLASARPLLKKLDSELQRILLILTSKEKVAYVMRGHGELSPDVNSGNSALQSSKLLEELLRDLNWNIKSFGLTEGSSTKVPEDAGLVLTIGSKQPFMKEEVEVLKDHAARGGALLIALDTADKTRDDPLTTWLESIGLQFDHAPVANDRNHIAATRSPADRWFLFTTSFVNHESTRTLSRNDDKIALLTFASGSLGVTPESSGWKHQETVRSLADSFVDRNRNYTFDDKIERRAPVTIAAASVNSGGKNAKMVVTADAGIFSDPLIRNPGNVTFIADSVKWLAGEQSISGKIADEDDVRIRHTGKQDLIWFYGSVLVVPMSMILAGALTVRGTRRSKRRQKEK
jgi:hypothetical protein